MLERATDDHHGGDDINIHYIAARVDDDGFDIYDNVYDVLADHLLLDHYGTDDQLAPIQRALDNLVRTAIEFGTTGTNDLWTTGVHDYDVTNLRHDDEPRAADVLNAALDFAKATSRHAVKS